MRSAVVSQMVAAGIPEPEAERHWQTVVDALCHGMTPTAAGLALLTDEDILGALPGLAGRAFIAAARADKPKPKRFKAGRSRLQPGSMKEAAGLFAEITRVNVAALRSLTEKLRAELDAERAKRSSDAKPEDKK